MTIFLLNTLLALAWIALTGTFTPVNFVIGFAVGFGLLWLTQRLMSPSNYFRKLPQVIGFVLFFLWELGAYQVYALAKWIEMRNRNLARFLEAVEAEDFTQTFNVARKSKA